ncbi:hypothetical protein PsYK624_153110 [Phanerochaete sordida]|uniref:Uncharacterized protein n=1 Tax=Phanerochaete sordida TaxID=48140 RepID=A0A9P3LL64_9APHY|nr:hypothetical protein PsYK624_153110 [Phanerochaete sordida]
MVIMITRVQMGSKPDVHPFLTRSSREGSRPATNATTSSSAPRWSRGLAKRRVGGDHARAAQVADSARTVGDLERYPLRHRAGIRRLGHAHEYSRQASDSYVVIPYG